MARFLEYMPGDSIFHRLSPLTKLAWVFMVIALAITLSDPIHMLSLAISVLLVALISGILRELRFLFLPIVISMLSLIIFQGIFYPFGKTILFYLVPEFVPLIGGSGAISLEGALWGFSVSLRFSNIITALPILVMTTRQSDLLTLFSRDLKMPYDYVLILMMVLRFIPTVFYEFNTILDAQKSRAFEPEKMGRIERLYKAYAPVLVPLGISSLHRASQIAMSMEARAYGSMRKRTVKKRKIPWYEYICIGVLIGVAAYALAMSAAPAIRIAIESFIRRAA